MRERRFDVPMNLTLILDREEDGRWIVEVRKLLGVMTYGATPGEAIAKAEVLARHITVLAHDTNP